MGKFSKNNFKVIIHEIEEMEAADQNIWVPIGILEYMFDDYTGYIDNYFHQNKDQRDTDKLWSFLNATVVNWTYQNKDKIDKGSTFLRPDPLRGWTWT